MKRFLALAIVFILLAGCGASPADRAGTYVADKDGEEVALVLKRDGKGTWTVAGEAAPITWEERSDASLWLHTRQGGVVEARVEGKTLRVAMPGAGEFVFKKR